MRLRFAPLALADVASIRSHIAEDDPAAADRVVAQIAGSISLLRDFPRLGRRGVVADALELVVPRLPYVIVYQTPTNEDVVILRVYHAARDRQ